MKTSSYKWKVKGIFHTDPQIVGEICEELSSTGNLNAEALVEKARPKTSIIHKEFEWDDSIAAEKYRKHQATAMIGNIELVYEEAAPTRAFVTLQTQVATPAEYEPIAEIMSVDEKKRKLLLIAKTELESFKKKYDGLKQLANVFKAIDEFVREESDGTN